MSENCVYLAGLFDGEGHLGIHAQETGRTTLFSFSMCITSTHRGIIDWLAEYFGGAIRIQKHKERNHKTTYRWYPSVAEAESIIPLILPYLIIKKEQALLAIEWFNTVKRRSHCTREETEHKWILLRQMDSLNHMGDYDE